MQETTVKDFNDFVQWVEKDIRKWLPESCREEEITVRRIHKLGKSYTGIHFLNMEHGNAMVNLEEFYDRYRHGEAMYQLFQEIASAMQTQTDYPTDLDFTSYEKVKTKLFVRLSNFEYNKEALKQVPYTYHDGLVLTYHIEVQRNEKGIMSCMVTNDMLQCFGVDKAQLHEDAMQNAMRILPPMACDLAQLETLSHPLPFRPLDEIADGTAGRIILTNILELNGAAVLFYPGMMELMAKKINGDYYVSPTSIHEVILEKAENPCVDYDLLKDILRVTNRRFNYDNEYLSNDVYYYSAKEKSLFRLHRGMTQKESGMVN